MIKAWENKQLVWLPSRDNNIQMYIWIVNYIRGRKLTRNIYNYSKKNNSVVTSKLGSAPNLCRPFWVVSLRQDGGTHWIAPFCLCGTINYKTHQTKFIVWILKRCTKLTASNTILFYIIFCINGCAFMVLRIYVVLTCRLFFLQIFCKASSKVKWRLP